MAVSYEEYAGYVCRNCHREFGSVEDGPGYCTASDALECNALECDDIGPDPDDERDRLLDREWEDRDYHDERDYV